MSLRWRLALTMGIIVAIAVTLGGLGAYASTRAELRSEIDAFLEARVDSFGEAGSRLLSPPGRSLGLDPRDRLGGLRLFEADSIIQVVGPNDRVLVAFEGADALPVDPEALAEVRSTGRAVYRDVELPSGAHRMVTAPIGRGAVVQVARSLAETDDALAGVRNRLLFLGVLTTAAAAAVGWLTARRIAGPIEELADRAELVARTQELNTPFSTSGPEEVGRLAASLTTMLGALDRSRGQQRQLVADASHELRTPLTTLRASVELLQRDDLAPADRERLLATLSAELGELTTLVTEIVDLGTDAARTEPAQHCDMRDLADAVAERARRRHDRAIEVSGPPAELIGQPVMLDRALTNLVDNAVKFTPADAPVEIVVEPGRVAVRDHGPGIDAADLPHVFERFYRSTAARTLPGSGLGLAIVAYVAEAHGGTAFARNADAPDGTDGAVVGFTFDPGHLSSSPDPVGA
ncbi:MAG: ATP-binding protein [Acidimicrobiales bacterium]